MKKIILFSLLFLIQAELSAQKFPVSYKIKRSFQECSECQVKTRSNWTLVSPLSYSEKLRESIEYKIFEENAYPEKTSWYFSDKDYDQPCSETMNGRHVWKDQFLTISDNITKDYFVQYEKRQAEKKDQAERQKKTENEKILNGQIEVNTIKNKEKQITDLRNKITSESDISKRLIAHDLLYQKWMELDKFKKETGGQGYIFSARDKNHKNDVNRFAWDLILNQDFIDAFEKLNRFCGLGFSSNVELNENLRKWRSSLPYNLQSLQNSDASERENAELELKMAANLSHCVLFVRENKSFFWEMNKTACEVFSTAWTNLIFEHYSEFRKKGIAIPNEPEIRFLLKCWSRSMKVSMSMNADKTIKKWFNENNETTFRQNLRGIKYNENEKKHYILSVNSNQSNWDKLEPITIVEENLFSFIVDKRIPEKSKSVYYYLDSNYDIHLLGLCETNLSDKKLLSVISKFKEIRDKDLGITNPK